MDYEKKDLTREKNYNPIKLDRATSIQEFNKHARENLDEVVDVVRAGNLLKLKEIFDIANTRNNIQNILITGSSPGTNNQYYALRLNGINSLVDRKAALEERFPGAHPNAKEIKTLWDEFKGTIPDASEIVRKTRINLNNIGSSDRRAVESETGEVPERRRDLVFTALG